MRLYAIDRAAAGEPAEPRPINNELRNCVSRLNSLDRWAVSGTLTQSRFSVGCWGNLGFDTHTTTQTLSLAAPVSTGPGTDPVAVAATLLPIPDAAGDPWVVSYVPGDGVLIITLTFEVSVQAAEAISMRGAVIVGSRWAVIGPPIADHNSNPHGEVTAVFGVVPVAAGLVFLRPSVFALNASASSANLDFGDRRLTVREAVR